MRIPDEIFRSVVFLGHRLKEGGEERLKLRGTAFVVSVPEGNNSAYHYLVTARHVARGLAGKDQEIRVNTTGGSAKVIKHSGRWWFHPTEEQSVDVAVCPFQDKDVDVLPVPQSRFLTDEAISQYYIGPGDEVSITGLFTKLTGESKNVPIVRRGSVAMLPEDKIPNANMGDATSDIDGYLIEVRSVGGLSGSPAFVRAPIGVNYQVHTKSGETRVATAHFQGDYFLLGLCHGHWEIPPNAKNRIDLPSVRKGEDSINLGIAIVIPARKILEVLGHPELVEMRKNSEKDMAEAQGTSPSIDDR